MTTYLLAWGKKTLGSTDLMHAWFSRCAVEPWYDFLMRRLSFMETSVQRRVDDVRLQGEILEQRPS